MSDHCWGCLELGRPVFFVWRLEESTDALFAFGRRPDTLWCEECVSRAAKAGQLMMTMPAQRDADGQLSSEPAAEPSAAPGVEEG